MSSAEAELAAMVEACKELLSIGCLLDTLKNGIPLDALGCPKTQHHSLKMELFTDSQSAQSITAMSRAPLPAHRRRSRRKTS